MFALGNGHGNHLTKVANFWGGDRALIWERVTSMETKHARADSDCCQPSGSRNKTGIGPALVDRPPADTYLTCRTATGYSPKGPARRIRSDDSRSPGGDVVGARHQSLFSALRQIWDAEISGMGRAKITIVGAGNVGATTAHWCAAENLAILSCSIFPPPATCRAARPST